jgi:NAD(P)-dependent dehydrogenase (short-subunit alcohol dehydrogenase family)
MNIHSAKEPFMSWTTADIPDLSGRVAVVTGANGGLGLETAKALAIAGAHVVMASRDLGKAERAVKAIEELVPKGTVEVSELDLGSLASIAEFAATTAERHPRIDILVNNAGLMALPERRTKDGFEMQFGVNHLGHFALTAHLLPALLAAPAARIVTVTSVAHHLGRRIDPDNPNLEGNYRPWTAYCQSKLANFHFAIGLHRRFQEAGLPVASLLAHPGLSNTGLQSHSAAESGGFTQKVGVWAADSVGMSAERGALPQIRAAADPSARSGQFYVPRLMNSGDPVRRPVLRRFGLTDKIRVLWEVSESMTGVELRPSAESVGA